MSSLTPPSDVGLDDFQPLIEALKSSVRIYPDFPKPGIGFADILPLFSSPTLHNSLIRAIELHLLSTHPPTLTPPFAGVDYIVGLEARGFLFGPTIALKLGAGFIPVRKQGKLPGETIKATYEKEYGADVFEMQKECGIKEGSRVVIIDDIIATGGSAAAAGQLVKQLGGKVLEYIFLGEATELNGRDKLDAPVFTLLKDSPPKEIGV